MDRVPVLSGCVACRDSPDAKGSNCTTKRRVVANGTAEPVTLPPVPRQMLASHVRQHAQHHAVPQNNSQQNALSVPSHAPSPRRAADRPE